MRALVLVVVAAISSAGGEAWAGDLIGTVSYAGAPPAPVRTVTTKDRATCGTEIEDESLLVADGKLANVVVVVRGAPARPPTTAVLDQERCRYRPHVQAGPVGSTLEIRNGDDLLHSVHGWAGRVTRFDVVTPSKGARVPTKLDRPGRIDVRCDVHSWMSAVVMVADGPAAVTGADGGFAIRDLAAGTYTVTAWHERLGEKTLEVTMPATGTAKLELAYTAP